MKSNILERNLICLTMVVLCIYFSLGCKINRHTLEYILRIKNIFYLLFIYWNVFTRRIKSISRCKQDRPPLFENLGIAIHTILFIYRDRNCIALLDGRTWYKYREDYDIDNDLYIPTFSTSYSLLLFLYQFACIDY